MASDGAWLSEKQRRQVVDAVNGAFDCATCRSYRFAVSGADEMTLDRLIKVHSFDPSDGFASLACEFAHVLLWHQTLLTKEYTNRLRAHLGEIIEWKGDDEATIAAYTELLIVSVFKKTIFCSQQIQCTAMYIGEYVYRFARGQRKPKPLATASNVAPCPVVFRRQPPSALGALDVQPELNWFPAVKLLDNRFREEFPKSFVDLLETAHTAPYRDVTLVPFEFELYVQIIETLYVPIPSVRALFTSTVPGRVLDRAQLETVAAATSQAVACVF